MTSFTRDAIPSASPDACSLAGRDEHPEEFTRKCLLSASRVQQPKQGNDGYGKARQNTYPSVQRPISVGSTRGLSLPTSPSLMYLSSSPSASIRGFMMSWPHHPATQIVRLKSRGNPHVGFYNTPVQHQTSITLAKGSGSTPTTILTARLTFVTKQRTLPQLDWHRPELLNNAIKSTARPVLREARISKTSCV